MGGERLRGRRLGLEDADPRARAPSSEVPPQAASLGADPRARRRGVAGLTGPALESLQRSAGNAGVARLMRETLARKVTVPADGWGSPLVGDDDSSVTFDPWATFKMDGDPSPFATDFADMPDGTGKLKIKAGTKGLVTLRCKVHVFLDQKWNEDIYQHFSFAWRVAADLKGKLTIEQIGETIDPPDDSEPGFSITSVRGSEGPSTLKAVVAMVSYQETDVPNVQIGGEIGGKKGGASGNITLGNETTYPAGAIARPFVVDIEVTDIPPEPPPEPKVTIESVSVLREYPIRFEKENQWELSPAQEGEFMKWWKQELPAPFREQITGGQVEVELEGGASQTGGGQYNRRLARRRITAVEELLRDLGVVKIKPFAQGEYDPETGEETDEDRQPDRAKRDADRAERRKVVVKMWQEFKVPPDQGGGGAAKP
jgi:hypothetical protein